MRVERRARRVIERALQRSVAIHDDGSKPGLYDLQVGTAAAPEIAIECVGAVDPVRTEAWNIGPAQGPIASSLTGDWGVTLRPTARIKDVRAQLGRLLHGCEQQQVTGFVPVERADVLRKLVHSGAAECHAYVPISFGGVPWVVESYLGRPIETLPSSAPDLPAPVTAVWITYGVNGLFWDRARWQLFDAYVADEDH